MGFLQGKKILITGMISERSIAYGIAKACREQGAELAFTYVVDKLEERVRKMAAELGSELVFRCDVASDDEINQVFVDLGKHWDGLDGLVHSIGFAPKEALSGDFLDSISREAFIRFTAACLGKEGIRCNGISAGPIKTLAASGIADLSKLLGHVASHNPLGRNVTTEEVGNTAAFLLSDLASGITGEITYVDGGYSINALNDEEN